MKKILLFFAFAGVFAVSQQSCSKTEDFLDKKQTSDLTEETVFADSARTMDYLTNIYMPAGFGMQTVGTSGTNVWPYTSEMCDEAQSRWTGSHNMWVRLIAGGISAINGPTPPVWNGCYTNVRKVNLLFKNLDRSPLSPGLKARVKAEARFLRAWYYAELVRHVGGVPLMKDTLFGLTDKPDIARSTFEECVNYINSELDLAAADLPVEQLGSDYGRVTKGACLALKARVLLYAASPLFNGTDMTTDEELKKLVGYPVADANRWVLAREAAKKVIDMNAYSLYLDNTTAPGFGFYRVFLMRRNPEYIFALMRASNRDVEGLLFPPSRGGSYEYFPTQATVDAFGMKNGKGIREAGSGFDEKNPYLNRDPRFEYSIIYNGSMMYLGSAGGKRPVFTHTGAGVDYQTAFTFTGYYCRKMAEDNTSGNTERCFPLMRYAEVLLNYAEACNETGETTTAIDQIIRLRERAGIQPGADGRYGIKAGITQAEARDLIRNERKVELAFEHHRFFDVRRWKRGEQEFNRDPGGVKIVPSGTTYTYTYIQTRPHAFFKAMYLMPIPQSEIGRAPSVKQNPGW
ncbi:RagB/SusD family nutrient uptake outer membrane protein [Chitinophaga lutea]|uniref:RagB/SusD family nutrient uptake outer membrane protein n=1 Tax=Chitinophaga lutea TaxID=2488634 RepID=A0A3N4PU55_9BACT|nr:RagB/SusD family nutrient uptake outer membrane protein [Chitinophaga lutea]RPE12353.1 RagB/SusD family nutrient uptake outer membrane protein [Chitinophaga lutea]